MVALAMPTRVARKDGRLTETFIVERVAKAIATVAPEQARGELENIPVAELVVVKRFGEAQRGEYYWD